MSSDDAELVEDPGLELLGQDEPEVLGGVGRGLLAGCRAAW